MEIISVIFIILCIILLICLFRKSVQGPEEFFNAGDYKDFTNNNKNLDNILQTFSKLAFKSGAALKNISSSYILTKNNLDVKLKKEIEIVIGKVLLKINTMYGTKYEVTDLERIKVETNILKERQVSVIFFIYELNKYSSRKVFIQYRTSINNTVNLNYIRTVQSGNDDFNHPYISGEYHEVMGEDIIDDTLDVLQSQPKCEEEIKLYTPSEHRAINLKLDNNCMITDLPKHISRPYVNPTIFTML